MNLVLLRKELRQLAPLLFAVMLLGLGGFALFELRPNDMQSALLASGYILLGIPSLFAVGAGAMSVSQEKETRTLGWLASLPLAGKRLITTKFIAAVLCWAGLWLVTFLSFHTVQSFGVFPFPYHDSATNPIRSIWIVYWILNSFYLLVCGFLTAWRFGSSMTALVAFIPFAIGPTILRYAIAYAQDPFHQYNSSRYDPTLPQCLVVIGCSLAFTIWLMNRYAMRMLAPQQVRMPSNPYAATELASNTTIQTSPSVLSPCTAMLWQFYRQNRVVYLSLCGACLVVGLISLSGAHMLDSRGGSWDAFAAFTLCLAASWMGVMVFQGDNLQERIRFLAERGVTPLKAWLTRQLLPLAFVCMASLFYLLILSRYYRFQPEQKPVPFWFVFWFLMIAYGYSQWFAQLVRNPVLSAIGAPLMAGLAFFYVIYSRVELSNVFFFTVVLSLAPFITTLLMMRRWMDRRFEWQFWVGHAAVLLIAIFLPISDFVLYLWNAPRMPESVKMAFREEGRVIGESSWDGSVSIMNLIDPYSGVGELTTEQHAEQASKEVDVEALTQQIQRLLDNTSGSGIRIANQDLSFVIGRVVLTRNRLLSLTPENPADQKDYQGWLDLLWMIATELRRSGNLTSQQMADIAEMALIAELQQPATRQRISTDAWDRYVALVSDTEARNAVRKRAVVASWFMYDRLQARTGDYSLGGFYPNAYGFGSSLKYSMTRGGRIDHLAWTLLRYLESGPTANDTNKLNFLRQRWPEDSNSNESVSLVPPTWVNDPAQFQFADLVIQFVELPGDQWFAGWEQVGAALKTSE